MVSNSIRGLYQRRYKKLNNEAEDCDCPKEVEAFLKEQKNHDDTVSETKPSFDLRGTNSDSELSVLLSSRSVQRIYDPPADGSCFFHCIVKKLDLLKANSQNYTHLTLRHNTIDWLRDHLTDYKDFIDQEDHVKYLSKMKKADEWADNLIIQ